MSMIELSPMTDQTARCVPVTVVAVKWPGQWIIRGMKCFTTLQDVIALVNPYVAAAPIGEVEWTYHEYLFPGYLVYGSGDLPALDDCRQAGYNWPVPPNGCVYLFPHQGRDVYRGPARRLDT